MSTRDQIERVLGYNTTFRGDCISCGGKNTLSIIRVGGVIRWRCFRNGCELSGKSRGDVTSPHTITAWMSEAEVGKNTELIDVNAIQDQCVSLLQLKADLHSTEYNNASLYFNNYKNSDVNLFYYPAVFSAILYHAKTKRVVFFSASDTTAVGRYMGGDPQVSKVINYGLSKNGFGVVKSYKPLFLVEDIVSMAALSSYEATLALLGTNLTVEMIRRILCAAPSEVIVALDKDATKKAHEMAALLRSFGIKAKAVFLERDPKDMTGRQRVAFVEEVSAFFT